MQRLIAVSATLIALLASTQVAVAAEVPKAAEANRVIEYYYSEAGTPVLMEFKLCNGVHQKGPEQHECLEEIDASAIEAGTEVFLWMKYLVPRDAEIDILTQLNHKGVTRRTFTRELDGAVRFRTWHKATFENTGTWEIAILHEGPEEVKKLHSVSVNVK